jgi:glyoxylase-like metal-dependent hydrolase (beta-lactamase superfamily II)
VDARSTGSHVVPGPGPGVVLKAAAMIARMSHLTEIASRIHRWSTPHPEWRPRNVWGEDVASFALVTDAVVSLVDPLLPPAGSDERQAVVEELDALAEGARQLEILITIPYHARSTGEIVDRYGGRLPAEVWGHQAVRRRLGASVSVNAIEPGRPAGAVAQAQRIGSPVRQETPLFFADHRALAFGDAVIGIEGKLRVWQSVAPEQERWYRERFLPSLRPLLDLDVERVLVTHGPPVLEGGRRKLADALEAGPWTMTAHFGSA